MTIKDTIKKQINQVLEERYPKHSGLKNINFQVEYPPNSKLGDYACNAAMVAARALKRKPMEVGEEIVETLEHWSTGALEHLLDKMEVVNPGFINFYLSEKFLQEKLKQILKEKERFGTSKIGQGKKIVIDYSHPNIAKKMHAGHLRSTIIGAAIYNLYKFLGYRAIGDNHLGDWGTQFGKLIYQYKKIYGNKIKKDITVDEMEKMYLDFHQQAKKDSTLEQKARDELKKLQHKHKFNYQLWQLFYQISLKEFKKVYQILKVDFDTWRGESFYNKMLKKIVKQALNKKVAQPSQGAIIIDLEKYHLPPFLIQKSDGAFLYSTTDLATIQYRHQQYQPIKNLYVVANQQAGYFEQLFKASQLLKLCNQEELVHIKFGLLLGKAGKKMSTREGEVVDLLDLIKQIIDKARKIVQEKNPNLSEGEKSKIAEAVGVGALKYNDLSQNRLSDINFDWHKMLSFESGSAPYLQYTFVRIQGILAKAKIKSSTKHLDQLKKPQEVLLLKTLIKFPEAVLDAAEEYKPNLIANYLEELASNFHNYYESVPIIKSEPQVQSARLALMSAVGQVIKNGLGLLGIEVLEKM